MGYRIVDTVEAAALEAIDVNPLGFVPNLSVRGDG
jgi:hypothetical protein